MKISDLQELLEKAKEEYGDVQIVVKHPMVVPTMMSILN